MDNHQLLIYLNHVNKLLNGLLLFNLRFSFKIKTSILFLVINQNQMIIQIMTTHQIFNSMNYRMLDFQIIKLIIFLSFREFCSNRPQSRFAKRWRNQLEGPMSIDFIHQMLESRKVKAYPYSAEMDPYLV